MVQKVSKPSNEVYIFKSSFSQHDVTQILIKAMLLSLPLNRSIQNYKQNRIANLPK